VFCSGLTGTQRLKTDKYFELKTVNQALGLMEFTINGLLKGKIPKSTASCLGYLCNILIGTIRDTQFEQRLELREDELSITKKN